MRNSLHYHATALALSLLLFGISTSLLATEKYAQQRAELVKTIEQDVRRTSQYIDKKALNPRVMAAMGKVPRHEFVPTTLRRFAYLNRPLPIGHGQTISQPYIVALMTDLINTQPGDKVLEVGTGSGYQAAILAEIVDKVYTIEIIKPLAERATEILRKLRYHNVEVKFGDGYYGWEEHAPFDAIVVTAAASHIPPPLVQQLKPGGRMIIPVGSLFLTQQLVIVEKNHQGKITTRQILPVSFVPLTGGH